MKRRVWSALGLAALGIVLLGACAELEKLGIVDPASAKDHAEPRPASAPGSYYPSWPALDGGVAPQAKREKGGTTDPYLWDTSSALGAGQPADPTNTAPPPTEASAPRLDLNDGTITRRGAAPRTDTPAEALPPAP